jgi:hypothetical protein
MNALFEYMPHLGQYELVTKVTANCFVPELQEVLRQKLTSNFDVLIQAPRDSVPRRVNCELFSMNPILFKKFYMNVPTRPTGKDLEDLLTEFIEMKRSIRMPRMTNSFMTPRGDCSILAFV